MSTSKITAYTVSASGNGELSLVLPIASTRIEKVQIAGTDIILQLRGGEQILLKGAALQAVVNPAFKIVFSDRESMAVELINAAGAVQFTETSARSVVANLPEALPDGKGKRPGDEPSEEIVNRRNLDQDASEPTSRSSLMVDPIGIAKPDLGAAFSDEASALGNPVPPSLIVVVAGGSGSNSGVPGDPPAPKPPADTISLNTTVRNLTGVTTTNLEGGGVRIQGSAGSIESATDLSPTAQAARELLIGTSGNDLIEGDGGNNMGSGFARLLTIQASARAELSVSSLAISGLPSDFEVVGAVRSGAGWLVVLPPDLAQRGNSVTLMLKYPVAQDGQPFAETAFDLRITATGVLEGKEITGTTAIPAVLRDVRSSTDLEYSVGGKNGFVFAAFGLGDDIRAGAGNDTIKAMVGADRVLAGDGNDNVEGGSGDDIIDGGEGADIIDGGTGVDTAVYANSGEAVEIDLLAETASGGEATGDTLVNIENIQGSVYADRLSGNAAANRLQGGEGNDWLIGRGGADRLEGGEGTDTADYGSSASGVTVNLADGTGSGGDAEGDLLAGIEHLLGSAFNDVLTGSAEANMLDGGAGNDTLQGGGGADLLKGGAGNDLASYSASAQGVVVSLQSGSGSAGDAFGDILQDIENLTGSRQADELIGNQLANRLDGGGGDDLLDGGAGADDLVGGEGSDTASYAHALTAVTVSLTDTSLNTGDASGDKFTSIENLEGSELDDTLFGDAADNILWGNPGDDKLSGAGGADVLLGGSGRDSLDGGAGVDTASYAGSSEGVTISLVAGEVGQGGDAEGDTLVAVENLLGSRFSDRLVGDGGNNRIDGGRGSDWLVGGAGADKLIGGEGSDTIDYSTGSTGITVNLLASTAAGGEAEGDTFESIENVVGGGAADVLTGDGSANTLEGRGGADTLTGLLGNDTLLGGDGDDLLEGGAGADTLQGGAGSDRAVYSSSTSGVSVNLVTGQGAGGEAEGDSLSGIENLTGSDFDDTLTGSAANNLLFGGNGNDVLEGGQGLDVLDGGNGIDIVSYSLASAGVNASLLTPGANTGDAAGDGYISIEGLVGSNFDDTLSGNDGANVLEGGLGNDVLVGLAGADTLRGGAGNDTVDYSASDAAITVNLRQGAVSGGHAAGDTLQSIESIKGTSFADTLTGDDGDNTLAGEAENDLLMGGLGADTLLGGTGTDTASYANALAGVVARLADAGANAGDAAGDTFDSIENLVGSSFNDELAGDSGNNQLEGGDGNDTLIGGGGADNLRGGVGSDTASYASATSGLTVSLDKPADNTGDAAGDVFESIENLTGSNLADVLVGTTAANRLDGGIGDDTLVGGGGADILVGGTGIDTASYTASAAGVTVNLTTGLGTGGEAQGDTLAGIENVLGSALDDILTGSAGANVLVGGEGADLLDGRGGADAMLGGGGDDTYVVDDALDTVTEQSGAGTDLVRSSVSYALGANVERLELLAGAGEITGIGNNLANTITGNESANVLDGGTGADTLIGGDGNDTYFVDNESDKVTESADAGTDTINASVSWTLGANLENLTLTGDADINATGNELANRLVGNAGANLLNGGAGADVLEGGGGDDIYIVDSIGDTVLELATQGTDTVRASVNHTLANHFENLELTGSGNINGTGNALANRITGNAGNNQLDGGLGADMLIGGGGDDIYSVDSAQDQVVEEADAGTDTVRSLVNYALSAALENLVLLGTGDINATGNGGANQITGNSGNNLLDGGGGADSMTGGLGDDTYVVDSAGDDVVEAVDAGLDSVFSGISYTLTANVENLTLTGSGNTNATGNELANALVGNGGNNTLDGGQGNDLLKGGLGDDTYIVDSAGDLVEEGADAGLDTVRSGVSYTLGNHLENLVLTGSGSINGTGNDLANRITGNAGNNTIDGLGGADTMEGGLGNDLYIVDNTNDQILEFAGEGTDSVLSSVSYALSLNVENIQLADGAGNLDASGNDIANTLIGNDGNNRLDGGQGADAMAGGRGDDVYIVDNLQDTITEASNAGSDRVESSVSHTLAANVENLTLVGSGAINATGNGLANLLEGNTAGNVLDGRSGKDLMIGGDGDDTYVVDDLDDVVTELAAQGADLVRSSVSYQLPNHVENLELADGAGDIDGLGNAAANVITGNEGNNLLDGGGGADTLAGGDGSDTYLVDNPLDIVIENEGAGTDLVLSSASYTLAANVENLTLTGNQAIDGAGNALANRLIGNNASNTLDGGTGADRMEGGGGDDIYLVDNAGDLVVETAGAGFDTVRSRVSYTLGANQERLELRGTASVSGTGNELANQLIGNDADNTLDGGAGADAMTGGLGDDTYVVDDAGDVVTEAANEGTDTVRSSLGGKLGDHIENFVLVGAALQGTGNALGNRITVEGEARNNLINGGAGADVMEGGGGNDIYYVDNAGDQVIEADGQGEDAVFALVSHALGANVESLTLQGSANLNGTGNDLNNTLFGNDGNNILNGLGGADTLIGGAGDDTYIVDTTADSVLEGDAPEQGFDTVESSVSYTLSGGVEVLRLTGGGNLQATGNSLNNFLYGNDGNNLLDGGGGADEMDGGAGDDTYVVNNSADTVVENLNRGYDRVRSTVTYTLRANVERLDLEGGADISGTGNGGTNLIFGNVGNNVLDGNGGANDELVGGDGDDTYIVRSEDTTLTELPGQGTDTVKSAANWTLGTDFEVLELTGAAAINGTGNSASNVLRGNAAANRLDGGGGDDVLLGGAGDDTYVVASLTDSITELENGGTDTVETSLSWALQQGDQLENITLTGMAPVNATGNELNNQLRGNAADNTLNGGTGADTMTGLGGNDTYWVDNELDSVVEAFQGGMADRVLASVSHTLAAQVEILELQGSAPLSGTGNGLANIIIGNSGNNTLDGGSGIDTLEGRDGNDTYLVDNSADVVIETSLIDRDLVIATASYVLPQRVEDLTLGGVGSIDGTGNDLNNLITGNDGDNVLDGGLGNDTMVGGKGNDSYVVDSAGDIITELDGEGSDTVVASSDYTLSGSLENLTLVGTGNFSATGSNVGNVIRGNDGNNKIDGGLGADTLEGYGGDDEYWVDNVGDRAVEASSDGGNDTVYSSVDFTLESFIERLELQGADPLNGTGNGSNNTLIGTVGNNILDGGGGADLMVGGLGDDTYGVDNLGDVADEKAFEGTDTVRSSITWELANHLENLVLIGSGVINGTGNSLANVITGNDQANMLVGAGGADSFFAGAGNDRIVLADNDYVAASGGQGRDTLALDRAGLNELSQLVGKASAIERLDFAGYALGDAPATAVANVFRISGAALNTTGLLGVDAGGRLEVVGDGMASAAGRDVLLLGAADFRNVFGNAPLVTMSDGSSGRLFASVVDAQHDVVVDSNVLVLPNASDLAITWGINFTPSTVLLPSSFGGLRTWLDATDLDGDGVSEADSEAGLTVVNAAQSVVTWADKSGNGVTFTALNGTNWRPTWQAAGVTGQTAVRFDGTDQLVSSLSLPNHAYTVYTVGQLTNIGGATAAGRLVGSRDSGWALGWSGGLQDVATPGGGWIAYPVPPVAATFNTGPIVYSVASYGPSSAAFRDGTVLSYFGSSPINSFNPAVTFTAGGTIGRLALGASFGSSHLSRGELSEVLVFDRALVEAERLQVDAYLRSRWATTAPPQPAIDPVLGAVGFDPTWFEAPIVFGDTNNLNLNDTLTASYGTAPERGAGKLDRLLLGGAGNDTLTGGARNDGLFGHTGNDTLIGGAGTNYLAGGAGNDTYVVSSLTDTVFEEAGNGTDLVQASVNYYLAAHVDNLTLTGTAGLEGAGNDGINIITGNSGNNRLMGAGGNDTLIGGAGNDVLDGGTGADQMTGGPGDDVYLVDNAGDVVTELSGEGTDTVLTYTSLASLPNNVENAIAAGLVASSLTGNGGANVLTAGAPQSSILAPPIHTLTGLGGDDTYRFAIANAIHTVVEAENGGIDTVVLAQHDIVATYTLPDHVENLDMSGAQRWSGTGNALNNRLTGPAGSAESYYFGERVTLQGLGGSDTYVISNIYTRAVEIANADAGSDVDTVESGISHRLLPDFENLVLRAVQMRDTAGLKGWGNASNNTLTGNQFNNWLDGAGGTDTLVGGAGDDNYVIDDATDTITETSTGGVDTVNTSLAVLDLNAAGYANVENLVFTGSGGATGTGTAANNLLAGTTGDDTLSGNAGDDVLYGRGGADTLNGGDGNDQLRSGFRPLPERPWLDGGTVAGLRLEGYTTTASTVAAVVGTHTGGLSLNFAAGVAPIAGLPSEGYRLQLVGDLTVPTAGWYTLRSVSTAIAVTIDSQRVLAYNQVDNPNNLATVTSLPVWLEAGTVPITVRISDPSVSVASVTTVDVRWARSDTYDAALSVSAGSYTVIPTSAFSYGQAVPVDTLGDTLQGGAGDDYLEGAGGTDTLVGGTGNDTYVVQSTADVVTELAGDSEGTADTLMATTGLNLSLENHANVENLTLIGSGAQNGTGSSGANVITGTAAANVLSGLGGDDTLRGNGGADTLNGGDGADVLVAASGSTLNGDAGNDTLTVLDPWSPELLGAGRLAVWLDAADLDGDGIREGMAEAGLNGNLVTAWRDKSGNGRHAEVYGEQQSPLLVQGGLNGLPSMVFDGVDDYIVVPGVPAAGDLTQSLYWVQNTTDSWYMFGTNGNSGVQPSAWMLLANSGSTETNFSGTGYGTLSANPFWLNGAQAGWTTRGSVHASLNGITASVGVVNQPLDFRGGLQFGHSTQSNQGLGWTNTANSSTFGGRIPEILVVSGELSVAERWFVEGYLAWKWGNQALLPADHPYRNAAPQLASTTAGATLNGGDGDDTLTGGMNGDTLNGGAGADAMAGGAGNDTYVVDDAGDVVTEAANAGTDTVQSSIVSYTLADTLENLVLTGTAMQGTGSAANNSLTGNAGDNLLQGLAGNDTLNGGQGADTLQGGTGDDTYVVDNAGDLVQEEAGVNGGTDGVLASFDYTLPALVENLTLTGTAVQGTGNGLDNVIVGNGQANVLDGLGGTDTLRGMGGNDSYYVDNTADTIDETSAGVDQGGNDQVFSSATYTLPDFVERLELTGTASNNATGNGLNNTLLGNSGDNELNGLGGADEMTGRQGNDTYYVDNAGDQVIELAGALEGSSDLVVASVNYALPANVERLRLVSGTASINATGNGLGNDIVGNDGANVIDGAGGGDLMTGLGGDDTYVVDNLNDIVIEAANQGTDTVQSAISYTLGETSNLENLTLLGTDHHTGTGNSLVNVLTGNSGNNTLNGKEGADVMTGGAGNDTYLVDNGADQAIEDSGAGLDTVIASVTYTLPDHVENLTLVGDAPLNGTGNAEANVMIGNQGNNELDGGGGNDRLVSGGGVDTLRGDVGDDRLEFGTQANIGLADGGTGTDTLVLGTVGGALDLATLAGQVDNIETLDLRDGVNSGISVDVNAILGMTDNDAVLNLSLDSGDVLTINSPYVVGTSGVDPTTGQTYTEYLLYTGTVQTATLNVYLPPPPGNEL